MEYKPFVLRVYDMTDPYTFMDDEPLYIYFLYGYELGEQIDGIAEEMQNSNKLYKVIIQVNWKHYGICIDPLLE